nr:esterase B1-like [Leptinotarsa decemlineata]XP_023011783.1 esterase B1-like [Leptinotarsa decemlineata]XP_023011790.1 esterase B1-like [Leptinotarsa decemlineata]XP_023011794.1 esterase B1-like [Leptinotarsa decemlineata]
MSQNSPIVEISQGKLKGAIWKDYDGNDFYTFLGIPYGKPPVGELRFKAPVIAEAWKGIRDASVEGSRCFSRHERTGEIGGSEDCLNLNIYTKALPHESNQLRPVMVYIHGGGFTSGSNSPKMYGPELLITEDIVMVAINYRIGIFGFLCLKDPSLEIPGNAGLKDQVLALRWIRENIEKFNGDPNNITIFGNSAGAVSASYLMLSPTAIGLFHKVILQSGCALNFYGDGNWVALKIAKFLGEEVESEEKALQVIKNASMEELNEVREKMSVDFKASTHRHFGAVIEYPNSSAFLTKHPLEIIQSGVYNKVPMMIGYNTREAMLMLGEGPVKEVNPEDQIPWQMGLEKGSKAWETVCDKIRDFYLKGKNKSDPFLPATDALFITGIIATIKHHLVNLGKPIFLYRMSLEARLNLLKVLLKAEKLPGACHADELGYLFKSDQMTNVEAGSIEDLSIRRFVKLWTNFAKYGNPTPDKKHVNIIWKPVEEDKIHFLNIGKVLALGEDPEKERMEFWKEIFQYSPVTEKLLP